MSCILFSCFGVRAQLLYMSNRAPPMVPFTEMGSRYSDFSVFMSFEVLMWKQHGPCKDDSVEFYCSERLNDTLIAVYSLKCYITK